MRGLTYREDCMVKQLVARLGLIPSAVVRSQLLMQMSQLVDMAYLGDFDTEREEQLVREVDDLTERLSQYDSHSH